MPSPRSQRAQLRLLPYISPSAEETLSLTLKYVQISEVEATVFFTSSSRAHLHCSMLHAFDHLHIKEFSLQLKNSLLSNPMEDPSDNSK